MRLSATATTQRLQTKTKHTFQSDSTTTTTTTTKRSKCSIKSRQIECLIPIFIQLLTVAVVISVKCAAAQAKVMYIADDAIKTLERRPAAVRESLSLDLLYSKQLNGERELLLHPRSSRVMSKRSGVAATESSSEGLGVPKIQPTTTATPDMVVLFSKVTTFRGIPSDPIEIDNSEADADAEATAETGIEDIADDSKDSASTISYPDAQNQILYAKLPDLSSLSLLSSKQTSSVAIQAVAEQKEIAWGSNVGVASTFQQIGTQKISALLPATLATSIGSNGTAIVTEPTVTTTATSALTTAAQRQGNSNSKSNSRNSEKNVESKYKLTKQQKTDAPMLNYIFDTFSSANKHHHHDQRYGPHFEDVQRVGQPTNMTVQAGSSIHLNCRISLLQDKTVSWVRRNAQGKEGALDLLTVGLHTYTGDKRYKMEFQYPSNWRLKITNVKKDDEAMYECQISTHPPRVIQINLLVNAPKVMIVDEYGDPLQEKYYEIDSTLQLSCVVRNVAMISSVVFWKHGNNVLNYDVSRGGVSVKTELMDDGANSTLFIAKINKADSGNYTCSISEFQNFTIIVHILNGESFAELHHGSSYGIKSSITTLLLLLFIIFSSNSIFKYS